MTTIAWTSETWNPIRAYNRATGKNGWYCQKVSPGCKNCYAEQFNRFRGNGQKYDVAGRHDLDVRTDQKALIKPTLWKKGRRVFVCSMTDLFLDLHTDTMIDRVFAIMAQTPRHTYQVLTKRSKRMREYSNAIAALSPQERTLRLVRAMYDGHPAEELVKGAQVGSVGHLAWPLPNVWMMVSAEDQQRADERIPDLMETSAAVRGVSYEPALGPVDFRRWLLRELPTDERNAIYDATQGDPDAYGRAIEKAQRIGRLHWIIPGGESGRGARDFSMDWPRSVISQCYGSGCAVFVKQMGSAVAKREGYSDYKGEDPSEWPAELRVREYPEARA